MLFVYHPDLVEQVVFLVTRTNPERECQLHGQIDRLYSISDAETRTSAFCKVYADHFTVWRLADAFESLIRTLIGNCAIHRCAMVPASRRSNQRVDLLMKRDSGSSERTLFIQVRPDAIIDPTPLVPWLRGELMQVEDMLDESFGYRPDDIVGSAWERKLRQDRYLVLWRIYVAGRLLRAGCPDGNETRPLQIAFDKAFRHGGVKPDPDGFYRVLHADVLTHAQLLAWSNDPSLLLEERSTPSNLGHGPGSLCPLCGFPTHDWFDFDSSRAVDCLTRIKGARPQWRQGQGACRQCAETYLHRTGGSSPETAGNMGGSDVPIQEKKPVYS